ncbi:GPALPP motifs-containing protein 1 [Lucilia sericata]|uniref:GPALPP motifs-containing protein 1 n=1 Tax=Lucilia sericata TaxID=13632 RepID=UPI0018A87703|nr:GPALPP motifs-containing protein 1 [Lucilia sericata]
MSSETDSSSSSSSSSSEQERKRKLHKKLKKKSEKKSKKHKKEKKKKSHKEKKRSRKETTTSFSEEDKVPKPISPQLGQELSFNKNELDDAFGPALPPHLINKNDKDKALVIGPIIPKELLGNLEQLDKPDVADKLPTSSESEDEEETLQGSYGPLPVTNEREMTAAQIELEQRALELKMAAIDGMNVTTTEQNVREEWMLELPDVGLKGGLAALNNLKRGFHQGKEKPDFSDRSSWTKTPQMGIEKQKPTTSKSSKEELELQAQALYEKQRDAEQEAMAKKHKKKHKREESLVEIHQKKLRKEERQKAKELKESGAKPERRPFTRDVDLKLNKIDRNQTKQIVDKAKILNTKFSSGHSKYL